MDSSSIQGPENSIKSIAEDHLMKKKGRTCLNLTSVLPFLCFFLDSQKNGLYDTLV